MTADIAAIRARYADPWNTRYQDADVIALCDRLVAAIRRAETLTAERDTLLTERRMTVVAVRSAAREVSKRSEHLERIAEDLEDE